MKKCSRCDIEMVPSKAIKPAWEWNARYIVPPAAMNSKTLALINVLKCPQCGHSEGVEE